MIIILKYMKRYFKRVILNVCCWYLRLNNLENKYFFFEYFIFMVEKKGISGYYDFLNKLIKLYIYLM